MHQARVCHYIYLKTVKIEMEYYIFHMHGLRFEITLPQVHLPTENSDLLVLPEGI